MYLMPPPHPPPPIHMSLQIGVSIIIATGIGTCFWVVSIPLWMKQGLIIRAPKPVPVRHMNLLAC